jgi:hypothetical protein
VEADRSVKFQVSGFFTKTHSRKIYSIKAIAQMGWKHKKWEILINLIAEAH